MCRIEQLRIMCETLLKKISYDQMNGLKHILLTKEDLEKINKIYIIASGNDYYAGRVGRYVIETLVKIPVSVEIASEFHANVPLVDEKTLVIALSHYGETEDVLEGIERARINGARILAITSATNTSVGAQAQDIFYTLIEQQDEITTMDIYMTQMVAFYRVALHCARLKEVIDYRAYRELVDQIENLAIAMQEVLEEKEAIEEAVDYLNGEETIFCLGRGIDYISAMKLAFELEEQATRYAQAFLAGELRHGPIGLIKEGTSVVAVMTQDDLVEKMLIDLKEVKEKGAKVIAIIKADTPDIKAVADYTIELPRANDLLMPMLTAIPIQILSYYGK